MRSGCDGPDGMMGAIAALEGVADAYTIIHGPTGCKYYPASFSESAYRYRPGADPLGRNPFTYNGRYFFSQPRLPCTYMDGNMFIAGAGDRLSDLYGQVAGMSPGLIGIVNSPGASLIGEDLSSVGCGIPTVGLDASGFSDPPGKGFQDCISSILEAVPPKPSGITRGVNLVGMSILHMNWEDSVADLASLLECCGVHVNCTIGAGWTVKDIESSADAELNVVVCPEYGKETAMLYRREYGIPCFGSSYGVPIGFDCLEDWIFGICGILGRDPSPALGMIAGKRRRAARCMLAMEACGNLPRGRTFSIEGEGSEVHAVTSFLYSYLGMVPAAVSCTGGGEWGERTDGLLSSLGIPASGDARRTCADVAIGSGGFCASLLMNGTVSGGIDMRAPSRRSVCMEPAPVLGLGGTMRLLDSVAEIIWNNP